MENTGSKDQRDSVDSAARLLATSTSTSINPEEKRQDKASRHSHDERPAPMQALYLLALEPVAETTADPNSYGFRPERSTADAGEQCFIALARKSSAEWVLEADIKGCFDNISHDWMIKNVLTDKLMLQKWLKAGYVYQNELFPTEAGTPQGGIASPALANMTLDGLEAMLSARFPKSKQSGLKMNMVRYADDFIITGNSEEWLENEVKPAVVEFLAERGLVQQTGSS